MNAQRIEKLASLENAIGYTFQNKELLNTALTHTSFVKGDGKGSMHNERLEFLGDAVLEICVSEYLYLHCEQMYEGQMTRIRAMTVCEPALHEAALQFHLPDYLLLGHGEESSGGRKKPSIISDALEALIGAVFLDGGLPCAKEFVLSFAVSMIDDAKKDLRFRDYKTMLQEYTQKQHMGTLRYELIQATGPDHNKNFLMQVLLNDQVLGRGNGRSKQEAGQHAAKQALECLGALPTT